MSNIIPQYNQEGQESLDRDRGLTYMNQIISDVVHVLNDIATIEPIWKRGLVHRGGSHYRLKGTIAPISIGEDECIILGKLIQEFRPSNCFIIGNAFGLSSVFIAKIMEHYGGKSVITLDSKSEGNGDRCFKIAEMLRDRMDCRLLVNKTGRSPQDINGAVLDASYDFIFIDGNHSNPQVTLDFLGVKHLAGNNTVICWHDYWLPGIPESVQEAQKAGFFCIKVNSSCEVVFGAKSEEVFRRIASLYGNTENPKKQLRPVAYLRVFYVFLLFIVKNVVIAFWSDSR